jgi:hypothetical protein
MKKIFSLIILCFLAVSSMNMYAYTIDVTKTYLLEQTLATSSKVIGANGTVPSVMSADISATSQRLSFELVSTGIYQIKNGDGNYLTCNSSGLIAYSASLDATTDAQWTIADIGTTGLVSVKSVSLPTSYLTSAVVITGPAAFTGSPLTLTTTAPTAAGATAFKLVEAVTGTYPGFTNLLVDGSFENVVANGAPLGEWINDKSQTMGGSGKSRVFGSNATTGTNSFQLRFNLPTGSNYGYYNISHKLTGLTAGKTYRFSFKYKVDGAASAIPVANAKANVFAASSVNDVVANAIGGATNYITTEVPTVLLTSQSSLTSNYLTFVAPASSCYLVFSKFVQDDTTIFYIYMDDMMLEDVTLTTGIMNLSNKNLKVIVQNNKLNVSGVKNFTVYSIQGVKVAEVKNNTVNTFIALQTGIYIVKSDTEVQKVIVK